MTLCFVFSSLGVSAQPPSESDPVAVPVSPPAADSQDIGVGVTPGINAVWPESVHTERTGVCPDFSGSEGMFSYHSLICQFI